MESFRILNCYTAEFLMGTFGANGSANLRVTDASAYEWSN